MSLTITTDDGPNTWDAARVVQDVSEWAVEGQYRPIDNKVILVGDRQREPSLLIVEVDIQGATVEATRESAQYLIHEAEWATSVTTRRGTLDLARSSMTGRRSPLQWHEVRPRGRYLIVVLAWIVKTGVYS